MAREARGQARFLISVLLFFALTIVIGPQTVAAHTGAPRIVSLTISPASPDLEDSLAVNVTVEPPSEVNSTTFFMCIISPKSLCYRPESMTRSGPRFTITTRALKDYPETSSVMDLGVKFRLNTSAGDIYFPQPGTKTEFGFEIASTGADPTGLYYKVHVEDSAPPPPPPAKPLAAIEASSALAVVVAASLFALLRSVSGARRIRPGGRSGVP